jgi:hypothetical protein
MLFDTSGSTATAWDEALKPDGYGTSQHEPFETWRKRNHLILAHLHPKIVEQWVYKHWTRSPYRHLPLSQLSWRQEAWATERILSKVFIREAFGPLEPSCDYKAFHGKKREPGLTMDTTGTWNYPIVVLKTPNGVKDDWKTLPGVRYCLIEGHQRMRYLNALNVRRECASEHSVFVLSRQ